MRENGTGVTGKPAVWQIVGYKNSGKTTLICALIPQLQNRGYSVAVIKRDSHGFEIDQPNTDTWRHREAGAAAIAITNGKRTARIEERGTGLPELVEAFKDYDYILVEGFKNEHYPKLVLLHTESDIELLSLTAVSGIVFWAGMQGSVESLKVDKIQQFGINETESIVNYMCQQRLY